MSSAAHSHGVSAVQLQREALARDLESKRAVLTSLQEEMKSVTDTDRNQLLWMIKNQTAAVEQARKNMEVFVTPLVIPQLKLAGITIQFQPNHTQFNATVLVNNDGIVPAAGSFELDLSVGYYTYDQDPPLYVDAVYPSTTPASTDIQPGATSPFVFPNIPFVTKPGSPNALYTFDVLLFAGPDGEFGDQSLHEQFLLQPRVFPRPIVQVPPPAGLNAP